MNLISNLMAIKIPLYWYILAFIQGLCLGVMLISSYFTPRFRKLSKDYDSMADEMTKQVDLIRSTCTEEVESIMRHVEADPVGGIARAKIFVGEIKKTIH